MKKITVKDITVCALFCALVCVGAFIKIPIPALPITLQVLFVLMAGLLLGHKKAFLAVFIYMVLGLAGLPIFAAGGGAAYVLKPSFGYIIGFAVGAWCMGLICERKSDWVGMSIASAVGIAIIYIVGILYYYLISKYALNAPVTGEFLLTYCFLAVIPGDIVSAIAAIVLCQRLRKIRGCVLY